MLPSIDPKRLLKRLYETSSDFAILTVDRHYQLNSWNAGAADMFGYTEEEIIGKEAALMFPVGEGADENFATESSSDVALGQWSACRQYRRKSGEVFWGESTVTALHMRSGQGCGYLTIVRDITQQKAAHEEISRLATVDLLTGLGNRSVFDSRTLEMLALASRLGQSLHLFMIDLDHFKLINDTHGHLAGDDLLRQVAGRLNNATRASDFVSRLGGDEFGLLQLAPTTGAMGGSFASKLISALAMPFHVGGVDVQISASIGISTFPGDDVKPTSLLKKADLALYKAKSDGGNNYRYFTGALNKEAHKRGLDSIELRKVVSEGRCWLVYQPIVDCDTGKVQSVEALIRFPGPLLAAYSVDYVIDLAREIGLICEIGKWVFDHACTQLQSWKREGLTLRMCVNTCAKELLDADYISSIEAAIRRNGLLPHDLEIELTERDAIDLKQTGSAVIDYLAKAGFMLSLDDFGTGYSSLSYLRTLPVSTIKLDKSFLLDVPAKHHANAVTKAIITLANDLDLLVTAEGVEDRGQARFLKELRCSAFQGYLFSRPLLPEQATAWLFKNRDVAADAYH